MTVIKCYNVKVSVRGMSLVEVLVSLLIISVSAIAVGGYHSVVKSRINQTELRAAARLAAMEVRSLIKNDYNWDITLANTSNTPQLQCLRVPVIMSTICHQGVVSGGIDLYQVNPDFTTNLAYTTKDPAAGYDLNGERCNSFDAANGNDDCPFRVELEFELLCGVPCTVRSLKVTGRLNYRPEKRTSAIRFAGVDFVEHRLMPMVLTETNCTDYGGSFDAASRVCSLPAADWNCPANQVLVGFVDGTPSCEVP